MANGAIGSVVTTEAEDVAREIEDQLESRDIRGLGFLALAGATGVIVAQEVTERVLPLLNMPREPQSPTQFVAAGAVKLAFALVVGVLAANVGGVALVFLAFHAVGAVVFAGADFVNALQRSDLLSESPTRARGGSGNPQKPSQPRAPNAAGGGRSSNGSQSLFNAV